MWIPEGGSVCRAGDSRVRAWHVGDPGSGPPAGCQHRPQATGQDAQFASLEHLHCPASSFSLDV